MATGPLTVLADAILDLLDAYPFVQLHTGDPGAAGTANVATEADRVQATWTAPAAGAAGFRKIDNTAVLTWPGVAGSEDYTHYSLHSAGTGGVCGHTGLVTANPVTVGDNFQIPANSLVISIPVAS